MSVLEWVVEGFLLHQDKVYVLSWVRAMIQELHSHIDRPFTFPLDVTVPSVKILSIS